MAILHIQRKKKDEGSVEKKKTSMPVKVRSKALPVDVSRIEQMPVLKSPRITEKVSQLMELNVYTFNVFSSATKDEVRRAVFARYNVMPVHVNMAKVVSKRRFTRGKIGRTARGKKAFVYLKKGDKIEIM